jgi:hypothetical protein
MSVGWGWFWSWGSFFLPLIDDPLVTKSATVGHLFPTAHAVCTWCIHVVDVGGTGDIKVFQRLTSRKLGFVGRTPTPSPSDFGKRYSVPSFEGGQEFLGGGWILIVRSIATRNVDRLVSWYVAFWSAWISPIINSIAQRDVTG